MNNHTDYSLHTLKIHDFSFNWKNYDYTQDTQINLILCCLEVKLAHLKKYCFLIIVQDVHVFRSINQVPYKRLEYS